MKLVNLIPLSANFTDIKVLTKKEMNEELDDMDVSLPVQLERYLDKVIAVVKKYNLPRKKEQYVIAKLVDALDMNPADLQQAVAKLKRYKIVHR